MKNKLFLLGGIFCTIAINIQPMQTPPEWRKGTTVRCQTKKYKRTNDSCCIQKIRDQVETT